jgi:hypothetical protein
MRMDATHDIFISYRREGGEHLAGRVKYALVTRGFSVFMDVEDLKSGRFDEALLQKIQGATDVLVILTPGCLERCRNEARDNVQSQYRADPRPWLSDVDSARAAG